jgi:hypothetical protein
MALASVPLLSSIAAVAYLPALPAIARSYQASAALLGWIVSVPALAGAACYRSAVDLEICTADAACYSAWSGCSPLGLRA